MTAHLLRAGDQPVPGFRLVEYLGRGQFGDVWKASAPGGPFAALKFISLSGKKGAKEFRALHDSWRAAGYQPDSLGATISGMQHAEEHFYGSGEGFDYNKEQQLEAVQKSIATLYQAGFDPRGVISLLERFQKNLGHSPYRDQTLTLMMDKARHSIVQYTPLRNPIVRTEEFLVFKKRVRQL